MIAAEVLVPVATRGAERRDPAAALQVRAVFITLLDEVDVPAREAGVLEVLSVREGTAVEAGSIIAKLEDTQAQLAMERAQLELQRAHRRADNDLKVRLARKTLEVVRVELKRGRDAYERISNSVSQTELDRLRLAAERAELELEQAEFELQDARLQVEIRSNELQTAQHQLERRQIVAPFSGLVVELSRQRGEWVEPGQSTVRLVRLDRLRAEGRIDSARLDGRLMGRPVQLQVEVDGHQITAHGAISFVSPEVQPVDGQVRIWAEIDNQQLRLRPGMKADMLVEP